MAHEYAPTNEQREVALLGSNEAGTETKRIIVTRLGVKVDTEAITATDFEGAAITVGTTAVELTFTGITQSVFIQSDHDNTGTVYVGKSTVTNAGANAMLRLEAGEAVTIGLDDSTNAIFVVSDTASQTVYKLALI